MNDETIATPGPWRWEVNLKSRSIELCGGKPIYDMTVMDFVRWGMNSAQPRFTVDGLLHKAEDFKRVHPDRDHHAHWFQLLNHPDANLIAAAPDLLAALKDLAGHTYCGDELGVTCHSSIYNTLSRARAAIDKAEGRS